MDIVKKKERISVLLVSGIMVKIALNVSGLELVEVVYICVQVLNLV